METQKQKHTIKYFENVKKALFVENQFFDDMKGHYIYDLYKYLQECGIECVVLNQAFHKKSELFNLASQSDLIAFASTFLYADKVKGIGDLFKNIKDSKIIIGQVIGGSNISYYIENIWESEQIVDFSHHKLFELIGSIELAELIDEPIDNILKKFDFQIYIDRYNYLKREQIERNAGFKRTSREIKIKKLQAVGKEWQNLKEGMVVYELDCSSIDPDPKRGVWVMGLTEPVKLLNDSGYDEWEYYTLKATSLAREFFSKGGKLDQIELMKIVSDWIRISSGRLNDSERWEWCDNLCETIGVERRGNRHYFEKRLKEYKKRFNYFKEIIV